MRIFGLFSGNRKRMVGGNLELMIVKHTIAMFARIACRPICILIPLRAISLPQGLKAAAWNYPCAVCGKTRPVQLSHDKVDDEKELEDLTTEHPSFPVSALLHVAGLMASKVDEDLATTSGRELLAVKRKFCTRKYDYVSALDEPRVDITHTPKPVHWTLRKNM
jgi:hypothetical protein